MMKISKLPATLLALSAVGAAAQTVTTTSLSTSQVVYVAGTAVDFRATVAPASASGNITMMDGNKELGSCTITTIPGPAVAQGPMGSYAGCILMGQTLATGTHTLTAVYSGDREHQTSKSAPYVNVVSAVRASAVPCSAMSLGLNGSLNGFIPAINDAFHQRVDGLPADPNSDAIIADWSVGHLHMDFSSGEYGLYGIPYYVTDSSSRPGLTFAVSNNGGEYYPNDSDVLNVWPGASNSMWIEGHYSSPQKDPQAGLTTGDDHLNVLDRSTCADYETYHTQQRLGLTPALTASSSAIWDMSSRALPQVRPVGKTSTEAGGLSVFEGLIRYDEVARGAMEHATRYQTDRMNCDHYRYGTCQTGFTLPATHTADSSQGHTKYQHFGLRLRLKASFDISGFSPANQVILTAWKQYGLILTDIGSRGYVSGTPDSRWDTDDLLKLQGIASSNFEAVEEPTQFAPDRYQGGTPATITSFTASSQEVPEGGAVVLKANTADAKYSVIDNAGFFRGNSNTVVVHPKQTTTYKLTTANQFLANDDGFEDGMWNSQSLTVHVTSAVPASVALSCPFEIAVKSTGTCTCVTKLTDGSTRACISPALTVELSSAIKASGLKLFATLPGLSLVTASAEGFTSRPEIVLSLWPFGR